MAIPPFGVAPPNNRVLRAGDTMTGKLILAAGTTAVAPLQFQSGSLLTTAKAGRVEFDGTTFYATATDSTRQVVDAEQSLVQVNTYTLTSQNTAQQLFNASANGAVTVVAGTHFFECVFGLTSLSGTSGTFGFGFATGGTISSCTYLATNNKSPSLVGNSANNAFIQTATPTALQGANTSANGTAVIKGVLRMSVGGTLTPQIILSQAAAAVVAANSFFRIWTISSSNSLATVGNWS